MTQSSTATELEVLHGLNRDHIAPVRNGAVRRFDELLAADFICSNPDGTLIDREGVLAQTARPVTIANLSADDVVVRLFGDAGIIHARTTYPLPKGGPGGPPYRCLGSFGIGRSVFAHVTRL